MRRVWLRLVTGGALILQLAPARSQLLPPAPPPPPAPALELADPAAEEINLCVPRFGNSGCAARLYAGLLCAAVGEGAAPQELQQRLEQQYAQAGIDFRGISASQIEAMAVKDEAPRLCPQKSLQIQELFSSLAEASGG
jgi:hypothetical protein